MSVDWDTYLPEVLPAVPHCPDIMASDFVRKAAIEFCEKSWIWKYDLTPDTALVAAQSAYVLTPPTGSVIHTIAAMGFFPSGQTTSDPVTGPISENELDTLRPGWREDLSSGINSVDFFTLEKNTIRVVPTPIANQATCLRISLILKPTRASTNGPDILYDDWMEPIAHGAMWKLMVIPEQQWSNPQLAAFHEGEFRKGKAAAFAKRLKGGGNRSLTVWPRQFGR